MRVFFGGYNTVKDVALGENTRKRTLIEYKYTANVIFIHDGHGLGDGSRDVDSMEEGGLGYEKATDWCLHGRIIIWGLMKSHYNPRCSVLQGTPRISCIRLPIDFKDFLSKNWLKNPLISDALV